MTERTEERKWYAMTLLQKFGPFDTEDDAINFAAARGLKHPVFFEESPAKISAFAQERKDAFKNFMANLA